MPRIQNVVNVGADVDAAFARMDSQPTNCYFGTLQFQITTDGELSVCNLKNQHQGDINTGINNMQPVLNRRKTRLRLLEKLRAKKATS